LLLLIKYVAPNPITKRGGQAATALSLLKGAQHVLVEQG